MFNVILESVQDLLKFTVYSDDQDFVVKKIVLLKFLIKHKKRPGHTRPFLKSSRKKDQPTGAAPAARRIPSVTMPTLSMPAPFAASITSIISP